MTVPDWTQLGLALLTLAGVATAWLQPRAERRAEHLDRGAMLQRRVVLYLDVLETKLHDEIVTIRMRKRSAVRRGAFEGANQVNYLALEHALEEGQFLTKEQNRDLLTLVRRMKTAPNMRTAPEVERHIAWIQEVRRSFPMPESRPLLPGT